MNTLPPHLRPRGRGASSNASGRYEAYAREALDDGWGSLDEPVGQMKTDVRPIAARKALSYNTSPDLAFDRTINPYRGCEHGCVYCYARPRHAYLGLSPGLDFETRIFSKPNAAQLLEREFDKKGYRPAVIALGGDTDAYQPAERELEITRSILETVWRYRHPIVIVTKSALVARDVDLLAKLAERGLVKVAISVTTLDRGLARDMEPRAATPERRLDAIRLLARAGVPVGVMAAPLIPALNDHEMEAIFEHAAEAGATEASYVFLRLPLEVSALFQEWLAVKRPDAAKRIMTLVRDARGGRDYDPSWATRGSGEGPIATLIAKRFALATKRLGLNRARLALDASQFRRPAKDGQLALFDADAAAEAVRERDPKPMNDETAPNTLDMKENTDAPR